MKKAKFKIIAVAVAIGLSVGYADTTYAKKVENWSSYAGNNSNSKTTAAKTIRELSDIDETNTKNIEGSFREPIIINDKIYVVNATTQFGSGTSSKEAAIQVYDSTGNLLKESKLASGVGFFSRITYGDGKIFVPLADQIQAFDAETLESLWVSKREKGQQMISSLTYYNGYVYSGSAIPRGATKEPADGFFFALSTKDEDPSKATETKNYTWTWEKEKGSGFYWANAAIVKNSIVFAGDGGQLVSHHLTKPEVYDEYDLSTNLKDKGAFKVRSSIYYDRNKDEIIVGTQNSMMIFSIKMDGIKFNRDMIAKENINEISGGIAATSDRVYVPSGGMNAKAFSVLDRNLNPIYTTKTYGTQSYPLISTAYGKDKYIYFIDYKSGKLIIAKDSGTNELEYTEYSNEDLKQHNSGSVVTNSNGDLILTSYGGNLLIIKNKNSNFAKEEIETLIAKLPEELVYTDKGKIADTTLRYDKFKKENPGQLASNEDLLFKKTDDYNKLVNDKITTMIASINEIPADFDDQETNDKVTKLYTEFFKLYKHDKNKVSNASKLETANQIVYDNVYAKEIIDLIDKLPKEINLDAKGALKEIEDKYSLISDKAKLKVNNYSEYEKAKETLDAQQKEVNEIKAAISDLPQTLTYKDQARINTIISRYNNLSTVNKTYIPNGDYQYLLDCRDEVNGLVTAETNRRNSVIKSGNTTNYYKKYAGIWFNYKRVVVNRGVTTTYTFKYAKNKVMQTNPRPNNGAQLTRRDAVTRKGRTITKRQIINYNGYSSIANNNVYSLNKKKKLINTYRNTRSYHKNKRVKTNRTVSRNLNTNKYTSIKQVNYYANGKRQRYVNTSYKAGKKSRYKDYRYNKRGQLKSNKYGKAYYNQKNYNKKGKLVKTLKYRYNAKGKKIRR